MDLTGWINGAGLGAACQFCGLRHGKPLPTLIGYVHPLTSGCVPSLLETRREPSFLST
jgi:hypothetical protein